MTMNETYTPSARTELALLPSILRQIESGEIRVPIFQRKFEWNRPKIRELFTSIYAGYPIGSILLMRTSNRSLKARDDSFPLPTSRVHYPTLFIIDGVQRLSSMYGALIYSRNREPDALFDVLFDLKERTFLHTAKVNLDDWVVSLSSLFSYDEFVRIQHILLESEDGELYGKYMYLYNVFQQYAIPITIIEDRSPAEVADIFIKINQQGKRLSKTDLDRALDWMYDQQE